MQVDVVYKIWPHCDKEWPGHGQLRFSLRSLSKFQDLGRVFIVGHKPDWVQNVVHLPVGDPYTKSKDSNLINKMLMACCSGVSSHFLNISDDQHFLKETSVYDLKPIISVNHKPDQKDPWNRRMRRTLAALAKAEHSTNVFEAHCPYLLDRTKYPTAVLSYPYGESIGMCGNTLYFNTTGVKGVPNDNYVVSSWNQHSVEEIYKKTQGARFLNINHGVTEAQKTYLQNRFPDKSIYER